MKSFSTLALSLIIISICTTALGARRPPPPPKPPSIHNPPGIYFDGNVGYGKVHQTLSGNEYDDNKDFTWNVAAGYQFNAYAAIESSYIKLPEVTGTSGYHTHAWDFAAKLMYPISNQFNVFIKGGAATSPQSDPWLAVGGLGITYLINSQLSIIGQFLNIFGSTDLPNTIMGTIGLSYKLTY